eukprot:Colp12_sorted_trinity150504_noHs@15212
MASFVLKTAFTLLLIVACVAADPCIAKNSVGQCGQCIASEQCPQGYYCCPYMKKCVNSGSMPCSYPIANCSPRCYDGSDCSTACKGSTSNPVEFPTKWQLPTCKVGQSAIATSDKFAYTADQLKSDAHAHGPKVALLAVFAAVAVYLF